MITWVFPCNKALPKFSTVLINEVMYEFDPYKQLIQFLIRNKREKRFFFCRCAKIERCAKLRFFEVREILGSENEGY